MFEATNEICYLTTEFSCHFQKIQWSKNLSNLKVDSVKKTEINFVFDQVIDTLELLTLDESDESHVINAWKLQELEGDVHSFLYVPNLYKLVLDKSITDSLFHKLVDLKKGIETIGTELWNVEAFERNAKWIEVRKTALHLLSKLKDSNE
jgi:hypothetical protein